MVKLPFFSCLILVLTIIYSFFFIEKKEYLDFVNGQRKRYFLKDSNFEKIKNVSMLLVLKEKTWTAPSFPTVNVDQEVVENFLQRLKKLEIKKEFKNEKNVMELSYSNSIFLESNKLNVELSIGPKQLFSENFYLRYKDNTGRQKFLLVRDSSPQKDPLPDELFNVNPYKRLKLLNFINSSIEEVASKRIGSIDIEKVHIKRGAGREFFLQNEKITSDRLNVSSIQDVMKVNSWIESIKTISAHKTVSLTNIDLERGAYLGSISLDNGLEHKKYDVHLMKDNNFFVLKAIDNSLLGYQFRTVHLDKVFPHLNYFFQKKIISEKESDLNLKIKTRSNSYNVNVKRESDQLLIRSKLNNRNKQYEVKQLITLFFKDADYVNMGNEMTISPDVTFNIHINGRDYKIGHAHGVTEIFDSLKNLSFFYRDDYLSNLFSGISL